MSLTEEILSPEVAAAAQRRRNALMGAGIPPCGSFGSGNNNDPLSSLLGGMGGGRTLGGVGGPTRPGNNNDPLSDLLGGMSGRNQAPRPPNSPPPMGPSGRPLGSPISQTTRTLYPPTGHAGGRMSVMAGLESLLGGLGDGLGRSGLNPGMLGPDFFGQGGDKDDADEGNTGTGTEGGGNTSRSGTWSRMEVD